MDEIEYISKLFKEDEKVEINDIFDLPLDFREVIYEESIIAASEYDETDFSEVEGMDDPDNIAIYRYVSKRIPAEFFVTENTILVFVAAVKMNDDGNYEIDHYLKFNYGRESISKIIGERE